MTNAEARFNNSLRPRKPEGWLGRTAQDGHLDSHTAPEVFILILFFNIIVLLLLFFCFCFFRTGIEGFLNNDVVSVVFVFVLLLSCAVEGTQNIETT